MEDAVDGTERDGVTRGKVPTVGGMCLLAVGVAPLVWRLILAVAEWTAGVLL